jgi:hypothetical protein
MLFVKNHHSLIHLFLKIVICSISSYSVLEDEVKSHEKIGRYSNLERKYIRYSDLKQFPKLTRKSKRLIYAWYNILFI